MSAAASARTAALMHSPVTTTGTTPRATAETAEEANMTARGGAPAKAAHRQERAPPAPEPPVRRTLLSRLFRMKPKQGSARSGVSTETRAAQPQGTPSSASTEAATEGPPAQPPPLAPSASPSLTSASPRAAILPVGTQPDASPAVPLAVQCLMEGPLVKLSSHKYWHAKATYFVLDEEVGSCSMSARISRREAMVYPPPAMRAVSRIFLRQYRKAEHAALHRNRCHVSSQDNTGMLLEVELHAGDEITDITDRYIKHGFEVASRRPAGITRSSASGLASPSPPSSSSSSAPSVCAAPTAENEHDKQMETISLLRLSASDTATHRLWMNVLRSTIARLTEQATCANPAVPTPMTLHPGAKSISHRIIDLDEGIETPPRAARNSCAASAKIMPMTMVDSDSDSGGDSEDDNYSANGGEDDRARLQVDDNGTLAKELETKGVAAEAQGDAVSQTLEEGAEAVRSPVTTSGTKQVPTFTGEDGETTHTVVDSDGYATCDEDNQCEWPPSINNQEEDDEGNTNNDVSDQKPSVGAVADSLAEKSTGIEDHAPVGASPFTRTTTVREERNDTCYSVGEQLDPTMAFQASPNASSSALSTPLSASTSSSDKGITEEIVDAMAAAELCPPSVGSYESAAPQDPASGSPSESSKHGSSLTTRTRVGGPFFHRTVMRPPVHSFNANGQVFTLDVRYRLLKSIGTGAYGAVIAVQDDVLDINVAVKKITNIFDDLVDAKRILREVRLLRHFHHKNITLLLDLAPPLTKKQFEDMYIITELMETDLHQVIYSMQPMSDDHVKYFLYQMLCALYHIHSAGVLHRDMKPSNILLNSNCDLKVCDFGLARGGMNAKEQTGLPVPSSSQAVSGEQLTEYVVTRWYRAPEIMLNCLQYTTAIDVWAVGCIFAEMLLREPLFPGNDYIHQLKLIIKFLGTPKQEDIAFVKNAKALRFLTKLAISKPQKWCNVFTGDDLNPQALDLLSLMLTFNPEKRISVEKALQHPYLAAFYDPADIIPGAKFDFSFDVPDEKLTKEDLIDLLCEDVACFHPTIQYGVPPPPLASGVSGMSASTRPGIAGHRFQGMTASAS